MLQQTEILDHEFRLFEAVKCSERNVFKMYTTVLATSVSLTSKIDGTFHFCDDYEILDVVYSRHFTP